MERRLLQRRLGTCCLLVLAGLIALGELTGCAGKPPPPPVPVKGKLTRKGQGVGGMVVAFYPNNASLGGPITANTADDGGFQLECQAGGYRILVGPLPVNSGPAPGAGGGLEGAPSPNPSQDVPEKYRHLLGTPLRVNVPDNGMDDLVLKMD